MSGDYRVEELALGVSPRCAPKLSTHATTVLSMPRRR